MKDLRFRAFPQFNDPDKQRAARLRHRLGALPTTWFAERSPYDRLAHAMAARRAIHLKELLEAAEFHARSRRRIRSPRMVDLCCGHGLVGLLFAAERMVEEVVLLDRSRPAAYDDVRAAVVEVFPEVADKVRYVEADVEHAAEHLGRGTSVIAVHACGVRTDRALDAAVAVEAPNIAVMGCCYTQTASDAPPVLRKELGRKEMTDIHRTYRLHAAGYDVAWSSVPEAITPMNRILIARRR